MMKELLEEYENELIGDRIYARVRTLVARLLRGRDPRVYAQGAHDYRDAVGDVVNEFALQVLIGERQMDYIMVTANDLTGFDRLILRQIRRFLARTRARTVIDNLIDRAVPLLRQPPFLVVAGRGTAERYGVVGKAYTRTGDATERELRHAAAVAQTIEKTPSEGGEREPKVYDEEALRAVLRLLLDAIPCPIARGDLQRFFAYALTPWVPSVLDVSEEKDLREVSLSPADTALVAESAKRLVAEMTNEDRIIFQYKYANLPDRELAKRLGLSRQSTAPRKTALFERLRDDLSDLDPAVQAGVLQRMGTEIANSGLDVS